MHRRHASAIAWVRSPKPQPEVERVLRLATPTLDVRRALTPELLCSHHDLLVVDDAALGDPERRLLGAADPPPGSPRPPLLLLSEGRNREGLSELVKGRALTNLVAGNPGVDAEDLLITVQKLLRRDIFGIEKYFGWGANFYERTVRSSSEKAGVVDAAVELAQSIGVHPRLVSLFRTVTDEFVTNAVYNAPTDPQGRYRFASLGRESAVQLGAEEHVEVKLTCDGRRLGVSASDPFGSFHQDRLRSLLGECLRQDPREVAQSAGGAGLGLKFVFDSLSHFIVNLRPGRRTEVIGIIHVESSYRAFAGRSKSFNLFVEG